eukprot:s1818_g18.t1
MCQPTLHGNKGTMGKCWLLAMALHGCIAMPWDHFVAPRPFLDLRFEVLHHCLVLLCQRDGGEQVAGVHVLVQVSSDLIQMGEEPVKWSKQQNLHFYLGMQAQSSGFEGVFSAEALAPAARLPQDQAADLLSEFFGICPRYPGISRIGDICSSGSWINHGDSFVNFCLASVGRIERQYDAKNKGLNRLRKSS